MVIDLEKQKDKNLEPGIRIALEVIHDEFNKRREN